MHMLPCTTASTVSVHTVKFPSGTGIAEQWRKPPQQLAMSMAIAGPSASTSVEGSSYTCDPTRTAKKRVTRPPVAWNA
eukprot:597901-Pyramimonas_sp.AAC.1